MPVSKKRKFQRKTTKQYRMVQFETDLFDGQFVLPDQQHMNLGLVEALNSGRIDKLVVWLKEAGVNDEDMLDAIRSIDQEEMEGFMESWAKGSLADLPK